MISLTGIMSAAVNPNKLINVPLADPTESVFGNRYFYGTVKGTAGRMTNVVLTEKFQDIKAQISKAILSIVVRD